jgi:hypothetical protein
MYSILAWQISILDSMNDKIGSRELYLPTVAVVVGDADGDDDGTRLRSMSKSLMLKSSSKSSMRGGGRAWRSWRQIRRDVAPPDLDGRRPIVKVRSSHADSASQKPYSSYPDAWSQRWGFWRPALPNVGACRRLGWRDYGGSAVARRRKFYLTTLGFFNWNS